METNDMIVSLSFFQWTMIITIIVALGMATAMAIYYGIQAGFSKIAEKIISLARDLSATDDLAYTAWKKSVHAHDRVDKITGERTNHIHIRRSDIE